MQLPLQPQLQQVWRRTKLNRGEVSMLHLSFPFAEMKYTCAHSYVADIRGGSSSPLGLSYVSPQQSLLDCVAILQVRKLNCAYCVFFSSRCPATETTHSSSAGH
jgi:hypothetical protein